MKAYNSVLSAVVVLTATAALATPAHAAGALVRVLSPGVVDVSGTTGDDSVDIRQVNGRVNVSSVLHSVTAGFGCVQQGPSVASCPGVTSIQVNLGPGNDTARNNTSLPSAMLGSLGSDRLSGGSGPDRLSGSRGADFLFGNGGVDTLDGGLDFDTCTGETESGCEA